MAVIGGRPLLAGESDPAPVMVLDGPLSFWGGLDPETGHIIDRHHPQHGSIVTGTVLVMPHGRGSSSSSSVLAEAIRAGTGPAAIVLGEADEMVVLGALVAEELYGITCPVVEVAEGEYHTLHDVDRVAVTQDGTLVVEGAG